MWSDMFLQAKIVVPKHVNNTYFINLPPFSVTATARIYNIQKNTHLIQYSHIIQKLKYVE
jgi:hypothetical protein